MCNIYIYISHIGVLLVICGTFLKLWKLGRKSSKGMGKGESEGLLFDSVLGGALEEVC